MAQVTAKTLGVPIDQVKIRPPNTLISPNDMTTGGSITSELCCKVCQRLGLGSLAPPTIHTGSTPVQLKEAREPLVLRAQCPGMFLNCSLLIASGRSDSLPRAGQPDGTSEGEES